MPEIFRSEKPLDPEIKKMIDICIELGVDEQDLRSVVAEFEEDFEILGALTQLVVEQTDLTDEEFDEVLKQKGILE